MPAIVPHQLPGPFPSLPFAVNSRDLAWVATTPAGDTIALSKGEILLFRNDDAAPQTVTIASEPDAKKRTGDITAYSIGIGEYAAFGSFSDKHGWADSARNLNITTSAATIFIAVLRL